MLNRRALLTGFAASPVVIFTGPQQALAQTAPSAAQIESSLSAAPKRRIRKQDRVARDEIRHRHDLRQLAPHIDIQAINFEFDSARIPRSEYRKVEEIAIAMRRMLRRDRDELFLIEGHTDAVGSEHYNLILSERRAASLARLLIRRFGIRRRAMETVGYGEYYLLVPTQRREWRNRRVTLRRVTAVAIP